MKVGDANWREVDGVVVADKGGKEASYLVTRQSYTDFVIYNTCSQQAFPLVMLAVQMAIAVCFSSHVAGQYILATSMLTLPATLVALTTAPVVYRHFIDIEHTAPILLVRYIVQSIALYLLAGVLILSPILFFGKVLFTIVFGAVWAESGVIAQGLSVAYIGSFAVVGVQSIFSVTRRLKTQFKIVVFSSNLKGQLLVS